MSEVIIGVDCDLHRIHAWDSTGRVLCKAAPTPHDIVQRAADVSRAGFNVTVLFEIAGQPYSKNFNAGAMRNIVRWAEFNVATAFRLECKLSVLPRARLLVATSDKWTHGHPAEVRHAYAKCKASTKDLREAEAMIFYYQRDPKPWQTVDAYLENL